MKQTPVYHTMPKSRVNVKNTNKKPKREGKIKEKIIQLGEKLWVEAHKEHCRPGMSGTGSIEKLSIDGKEHTIEFDFFWEGSNYFDYKVLPDGIIKGMEYME